MYAARAARIFSESFKKQSSRQKMLQGAANKA
jgi:hypothetical protein